LAQVGQWFQALQEAQEDQVLIHLLLVRHLSVQLHLLAAVVVMAILH
jgi:hypothetical protein